MSAIIYINEMIEKVRMPSSEEYKYLTEKIIFDKFYESGLLKDMLN